MGVHRIDPWEFVPANRELLAGLPLAGDIAFELIELFFQKCEYLRLDADELLLSPGTPNHYLYLVLRGELTIFIDALGSKNTLVVPPGEFVGEVSIIDSKPPTGFVAAAIETLVLAIPEELLWSEFFAIPGSARNLMRQLARRLRERYIEMQRSIERTLRLEHLEKELGIARDLQAGMLPVRPLLRGHGAVEVDAVMRAAKEIGGDFYDAFPLDEYSVCVAVGDVAGKGVPAALFMVRCLTLLRTGMLQTRNLLTSIQDMNSRLCEDNTMCMFVTLAICVVDVRSGRLEFVNGGHNRPLIGARAACFEPMPPPRGMLLGINPVARFELHERMLAPGEAIVLYTDGITEAMNGSNEEFGEERMLAHVNALGPRTAEQLVEEMRAAAERFADGAEQSDDMTVLVLRWRGA